MSKKEKKLINLVSAIKMRGYNVEEIYEKMVVNNENSYFIEK